MLDKLPHADDILPKRKDLSEDDLFYREEIRKINLENIKKYENLIVKKVSEAALSLQAARERGEKTTYQILDLSPYAVPRGILSGNITLPSGKIRSYKIPYNVYHYGKFSNNDWRNGKRKYLNEVSSWADMPFSRMQTLFFREKGYYLLDVSDPDISSSVRIMLALERPGDYGRNRLWHHLNLLPQDRRSKKQSSLNSKKGKTGGAGTAKTPRSSDKNTKKPRKKTSELFPDNNDEVDISPDGCDYIHDIDLDYSKSSEEVDVPETSVDEAEVSSSSETTADEPESPAEAQEPETAPDVFTAPASNKGKDWADIEEESAKSPEDEVEEPKPAKKKTVVKKVAVKKVVKKAVKK